MSYQVLARKWRPKTFNEMVGQEHVLKALINALDHNRLHHAYLFTGTRGVGKTTIARILARCFNCETGISSQPCGECSACLEIGDGRFVDLLEVDAASRTKVEDTRELLDNVQYAPTRGRFKIYLIDEVHMLSNHSFNALLKTLEEPPEHVKFLLATTDPQKLPVTVLSRCLQFNLKNMSPERIVAYLEALLGKEVIPFEESALWMLARAADGSMRDALSLTDQAISFGNGRVVESEVSSMLGTIDHRLVQNLIQGLIDESPSYIMEVIASFAEHAPDYNAAMAELLALLHRIAIAQAVPEALDNSFGDRHQILEFARMTTPEDIQLYYQTALVGRRDLPLAADPRSGFEMTMLRMLAFKPQGVVDVPTRTLKQQEETDSVAAPVAEVAGDIKKPEPSTATAPQNVVSEAPERTSRPALLSGQMPGQAKRQEMASTPALDQPDKEQATPVSQGITKGITNATTELPNESDTAVLSSAASGAAPSGVASDVGSESVASTVPVDGESSDKAALTALREKVKAIAGTEGFVKAVPEKAVTTPSVENPHTAVTEEGHNTASDAKIGLEQFSQVNWIKVYKQLKIKGILQSTACNCILVGRAHNQLNFAMDESKGTLFDQSHVMRLEGLLSDYFGEPVRVSINLMALDGSQETPAQIIEREKQERHAAILADLKDDPVVNALEQAFEASLIEESIRYS